MIDLKNELSYEEYFNSATAEEKEIIKEFYDKTTISKESRELVQNIKSKKEISVFSLHRCKDAATSIPVLMELSKENPNLHIKFYLRDDNSEALEKLTGEVRVPSILIHDENGNITKKFIEFPKVVKEKIEKNPKEMKEEIVSDFRNGKYKEELEKEIVELLIH